MSQDKKTQDHTLSGKPSRSAGSDSKADNTSETTRIAKKAGGAASASKIVPSSSTKAENAKAQAKHHTAHKQADTKKERHTHGVKVLVFGIILLLILGLGMRYADDAMTLIPPPLQAKLNGIIQRAVPDEGGADDMHHGDASSLPVGTASDRVSDISVQADDLPVDDQSDIMPQDIVTDQALTDASSSDEAVVPEDVITQDTENEAQSDNIAISPVDAIAVLSPHNALGEALSHAQERLLAGEQRIAELNGRLAQAQQMLEHTQAEYAQKQAVLYAYMQFKERARQGQPYAEPLAVLQSDTVLVTDKMAAQLSYVAPMADTGIATDAELRKAFGHLVEVHHDTNHVTQPPQSGIIARVQYHITSWLASLVRIRKIGNTHRGGDAASILAHAEYLLDTATLDEALTLLTSSNIAAEPELAAWIEQARMRADLHDRLLMMDVALQQVLQSSPDITGDVQ